MVLAILLSNRHVSRIESNNLSSKSLSYQKEVAFDYQLVALSVKHHKDDDSHAAGGLCLQYPRECHLGQKLQL